MVFTRVYTPAQLQCPVQYWAHLTFASNCICISNVYNSLEPTWKPPWHFTQPHMCFLVYADASRHPRHYAICFQMLQEHSEGFLNEPLVSEVESGLYENWCTGGTNSGAAETSAQVSGRLGGQLRLLLSSVWTLVLYSHYCGSWCHISTRHIVHHIHLYYSHKIYYII